MGGVAGGGKNDDPYRVILKMKPVTWGSSANHAMIYDSPLSR